MREIKFRALNLDNNKMLYQDIDFGYVSTRGIDLLPLDAIVKTRTNYTPRVIIMQYTGLKDSKGTEIYEGDIVRDSSGKGQVGYSPPGFVVDTGDPLRFWLGGGKEYPPNWKLADTEVIGNIYQNHEPLHEKITTTP